MTDDATPAKNRKGSVARWVFAVGVVLLAVALAILNYVGGGLQGKDIGSLNQSVRIREYGWPRAFIIDSYADEFTLDTNDKLVPSPAYRFVNRQFRSSEFQTDIGIGAWIWVLGAMILHAICFRKFSLKLAFAFMIFTGIIIVMLQTHWVG